MIILDYKSFNNVLFFKYKEKIKKIRYEFEHKQYVLNQFDTSLFFHLLIGKNKKDC